MYLGNENLRNSGQQIEYTKELLQEYIRCKDDIIYFLENYYYIITLDDGKKLFHPWPYQKKVVKCFEKPPEDKRHLICLMPRQMGKTTITGGYLLHYALFNEDKTVAIMANKQETAIEIMDRIKLAYEHLPLWLQQGIEQGGWNSKSIKFENGSRIFASTTSSSSISGKSINCLYLDEFAKIPSHVADAFITATYPVISSGKTSKIIITSTPLGMNHFYDFWIKAFHKENDFYPIKVHWSEHPNRDREWKKKEIRNIGKVKFSQEFGCRFLGSNSTLIDADILDMIDYKDPINEKWNYAFQIFEEPIPGALYVCGIDSSKGIGNDSSVIQILKITTNRRVEQVAVYRNPNISPYDFAQVIISVSKYYNEAMLMIENNGEGGQVCDTIWHQFEYDNIVNLDKNALGIRATRSTKLEYCLLMKQYIENEWLKINHKDTLDELTKFVEVKPNIFRGETHKTHDDLVTALGWALLFLTCPYYDGPDVANSKIKNEFKINNTEDEEDDTPVTIIDPDSHFGNDIEIIDIG